MGVWEAVRRFTLLLLGVGCAFCTQAAETNAWAVGFRSGLSQSGSIHTFTESETFLQWVPARCTLGTNWSVSLRLELTAGYLENRDQYGFVGTIGPAALFQFRDFPILFDFGVSATGLNPDRYPSKDFGIPFQFTSHVGVEWRFMPEFNLNYRAQHMSNAQLSSSNPGLNMHLFGIAYQF